MPVLVKSRFTIRLAENSEGPLIAELLRTDYYDLVDFDFSQIYPFWLVAEQGGKLVGCIMLAIGKPVGFLEFMATDPELPPHARAKIVRMLLIQGCASLGVHGSQYAAGNIPFRLKSYKRALKKRGAHTIWQGNTLMLRLY